MTEKKENKPAEQAGGKIESNTDPIHGKILAVSEQYFKLMLVDDDRALTFNCGMRK